MWARRMKQIPRFLIILVFFSLGSCLIKQDNKTIQLTFSKFIQAVQGGNSSSWTETAPFLMTLDQPTREQTLQALQKLFNETTTFSIRLIDAYNAQVILSDKNRTIFPFKKEPDGRWVMAEYVKARQTIDFIPRK